MSSLRSVLIYALTQIRRSFRDRTALFFTVLFPLIFLLIFGFIYGGGSSSSVTLNVALINRSKTQMAQEFVKQIKDRKDNTFKVIAVTGLSDAKTKMNDGSLDSIIELPQNFGSVRQTKGNPVPAGQVLVYYSKVTPTSGQMVASIISGILSGVNTQLIGAPPLTVQQKSLDTSNLSAFSYIFSGLFAFSLMSMTIFGLGQQLPSEKKTGSLRRVEVTPFTPWQMIVGSVLAYLVLTACSAIIFVIVGILAFHFQMEGSWLTLAIFALFSAFVMAGFGMIVAGWARNQQQANPISMAIGYPLMFLSGVFIPRFMMPGWLQKIGGWMPMSPVVDGVRAITTQNYSLLKLGPEIGILAIWGVAAYIIAFLVFRWE